MGKLRARIFRAHRRLVLSHVIALGLATTMVAACSNDSLPTQARTAGAQVSGSGYSQSEQLDPGGAPGATGDVAPGAVGSAAGQTASASPRSGGSGAAVSGSASGSS